MKRKTAKPTTQRRPASRASLLCKKNSDLLQLGTEKSNRASADLDRKSAIQIARIINTEDAKVAAAVRRALPQIAQAIDRIAGALAEGGRLIYVGSGTSGRIAALDAVECAPTFHVPPGMVQFVIAGGNRALAAAIEADEDSAELGRKAIAQKHPTKNDVVVGLAASGRTPFTIAALEYARGRGAKTIAVVCNPKSPLGAVGDIAIIVEVGPEVIAGSTRMKAGTAQKMILNMLSTGALARLGYVYGNLMVNVRPKNEKLVARGMSILEKAAGLDHAAARRLLVAAGGSVPVAVVMAKAGVPCDVAQTALKNSASQVRNAIATATAMRNSGKPSWRIG